MNNQKSERPLLPPEVFIRKMNNLYPNIWAAIKKNRENIYRLKENGRPVIMEFPSWMEMTTDLVHYTINHNDAYREVLALSKAMGTEYYMQRIEEITAMAPVYAWKKSKNVYRFSQELYNELIHQELDTSINMDVFFQLPQYGTYVETPGLKRKNREIKGVLAYIELDSDANNRGLYCLNICYFPEDHFDPFIDVFEYNTDGHTTLQMSFDNVLSSLKALHENVTDAEKLALYNKAMTCEENTRQVEESSPFLNLLMFLCSKEPDISEASKQETHHHGKHNKHTDEPKEWDVGIRISRMLSRGKNSEQGNPEGNGLGSAKRPHIRSAHWHSYWIGPRDETYPNRRIIIKWLPPIPINVRDEEALPVVIREVPEKLEN